MQTSAFGIRRVLRSVMIEIVNKAIRTLTANMSTLEKFLTETWLQLLQPSPDYVD